MEKINNKKNKNQTKRKIIIAFSSFFTLLLIILIGIPGFALSTLLNQRYEQPQYDPIDFGIEAQHMVLETSDDLALSAWRVHTPVDDPRGTIVIISGIQYPSVTAFFGYARMFSDNGWDTLLIEKRARSLSEGETIGLALTEWLDVEAGVRFLEEDKRARDLPIVTLGTSAGGATVIVAGAEIPRIDGVIAISAYTNFIDVYVDSVPSIGIPRFVGELTRPFMWLHLGFLFGFSELHRTPVNSIENLGERPLLLMHSREDWQVSFSHFEVLVNVAEDNDVALSTFVREGDWHFVVYNQYIYEPERDIEFQDAIFDFLEQFD